MSINKETVTSVILLILFLVFYFLYGGFISNKELKEKELNKLNDHFTSELQRECERISVGMSVDDADLLVFAGNRISRMSGENGGYIKYWKSISPKEINPVGNICEVKYDVNKKIYSVNIITVTRKQK